LSIRCGAANVEHHSTFPAAAITSPGVRAWAHETENGMTQETATATRRRQGRRFVVPVVAVVAVAMLGALMTLAGSTPSAVAQLGGTTCYTINDTQGTMTSWTGGTQTVVGDTGLTAVEALAANQDRNQLWTFDNATQEVSTFTPGSATPTSQFTFTAGDLDSLTWVNHTDGDPSNDQLWGTFRNPVPNVNNGPNVADQIVRIDPDTGAILSGPTNITDPGAGTNDERDDNDGLIWDPQTDNVYGVIGGDTTSNELITINPADGSITQLALNLAGGPIFDIESLGAGTDGQLYGTTGADGADANQFISIDKVTGAVTVIGQFDTILSAGGVNENVDYEATACLTEAPVSVTAATCFIIDEGNQNQNDGNHLVQADIAADGTTTFTDLGLIPNAINIESVAYRNGFSPAALYTYDPAQGALIRIDETDGTSVVIVASPTLGDIDGLTFRNDNDNDPSNDELWGVVRNAVGEDELIQIDPDSGAILSTVTIQTNGATGGENDVDGLAWDPSTDTFYAPVNGSAVDNELITIDRTTGAVTSIGTMGITDVEGLGFTDAGELFGSTGASGPTPDIFLTVDKNTGVATQLGNVPIFADYESLDCAGDVPPLASLGDKVFLDLNEDGIQDAGEPPVPGVVVTLDGPGGTQTTTTDVDGMYTFGNLQPGTYTVTFTAPADTIFTVQDAGADEAADSDVNAAGETAPVTLVSGENNPDIDAGLIPARASLGDKVFLDLNEDGIQDAGEPPVAGVNVTLTLVAGENNPDIDAGLLPLRASLGDKVFIDLNEDGIQDAGEPGVPGVTVTLTPADGSPAQTVVTDADGMYLFTDLAPGDYSLTFTDPDGREFTTQDAGADDAADSDVNAAGETGVVTLDAGENDPTIDAGLLPARASLGDKVFFDTNEDGVQDAGEPPVRRSCSW